MYIKDLKKHRKIHLNKEVSDFEALPKSNVLLLDYLTITYDVNLSYNETYDAIDVDGIINFKILVTDARDGRKLEHSQEVPWTESYNLDDFDGDELNVDLLVAVQINANIPMNFTKNHGTITKTGPGWSVMSEEEYENEKANQSDPRWDKLKEASEKKK